MGIKLVCWLIGHKFRQHSLPSADYSDEISDDYWDWFVKTYGQDPC